MYKLLPGESREDFLYDSNDTRSRNEYGEHQEHRNEHAEMKLELKEEAEVEDKVEENGEEEKTAAREMSGVLDVVRDVPPPVAPEPPPGLNRSTQPLPVFNPLIPPQFASHSSVALPPGIDSSSLSPSVVPEPPPGLNRSTQPLPVFNPLIPPQFASHSSVALPPGIDSSSLSPSVVPEPPPGLNRSTQPLPVFNPLIPPPLALYSSMALPPGIDSSSLSPSVVPEPPPGLNRSTQPLPHGTSARNRLKLAVSISICCKGAAFNRIPPKRAAPICIRVYITEVSVYVNRKREEGASATKGKVTVASKIGPSGAKLTLQLSSLYRSVAHPGVKVRALTGCLNFSSAGNMALDGGRFSRNVPEILRQNCFLRNEEPFSQVDPKAKRGKFLVRHCRPTYHYWVLRRETCGRSLITVYDVRQDHTEGHQLGSVWFPATAEIIDACICRFDAGQPGLVVAVKDRARTVYPNYLAYCVIGFGIVAKTIGIDYPITSVECMIDSADIAEKSQLAEHFASFPQLIAVGTEQGHCYITHFGLSRPVAVDNPREPVKPPRTIDCTKPYHKKPTGFQPVYNYENITVPVMSSGDVYISALCYVNRCFTLFIGFNFGAVLSLNLSSQRLEMRHVSPGPVVSFALQEPEDDPRPQLFLWVGCNGRRDARPVLRLFSINFLAADEETETTYENAVYSKPYIAPFLEWYPEECSRLISLRTVYMNRSESDLIRKEDGSEASIIGASGGFGSRMTSSLMLVSWIAKRTNSIKYYGSLFDLNNLYYRRLVRRIEQDKTAAKQFHTMAVYSSKESGTEDFILKAGDILDVVADVDYGITRFKNNSADHADQLMYPSSYEFKCFALSQHSMGDLRITSLQRQVLERYAEKLLEFIERPLLPAQYLRAIGIESQNAQQFKTKPEMALILSAMLYYDHSAEVVEVIQSFKETITLTLSLKDLAEWIWREVELTKKRLDEIAHLLRTGTITQMSPEACHFIQHAANVFQGAINILIALAERAPGAAQVQLNFQVEAVRALALYVDLLIYLTELRILPEREATKVAVDGVRTTIEEARAHAAANNRELNIWHLVQQVYDSTKDNGFWGSEGADDWYPPASVVSVIDIALLSCVTETWKLHIIGYFLLDYGVQVKDSRKAIFKKFGHCFLNTDERDGILGMWHEDQKSYMCLAQAHFPDENPLDLMKKAVLRETDYNRIRNHLVNVEKAPARWNAFVLERQQFDRVIPDVGSDEDENMGDGVESASSPPVATPQSRKRDREYMYELPENDNLNVTVMNDEEDEPEQKRFKFDRDAAHDGSQAPNTPRKFLPATPVVNKSVANTQKFVRESDWNRVTRVLQTPTTVKRRQAAPMRTPTTPEMCQPEVAPPTSILKTGSMSRLNRGNITPSRLRFASPERLTKEHAVTHCDTTNDSSVFSETTFAAAFAGEMSATPTSNTSRDAENICIQSFEEQAEEDFVASFEEQNEDDFVASFEEQDEEDFPVFDATAEPSPVTVEDDTMHFSEEQDDEDLEKQAEEVLVESFEEQADEDFATVVAPTSEASPIAAEYNTKHSSEEQTDEDLIVVDVAEPVPLSPTKYSPLSKKDASVEPELVIPQEVASPTRCFPVLDKGASVEPELVIPQEVASPTRRSPVSDKGASVESEAVSHPRASNLSEKDRSTEPSTPTRRSRSSKKGASVEPELVIPQEVASPTRRSPVSDKGACVESEAVSHPKASNLSEKDRSTEPSTPTRRSRSSKKGASVEPVEPATPTRRSARLNKSGSVEPEAVSSARRSTRLQKSASVEPEATTPARRSARPKKSASVEPGAATPRRHATPSKKSASVEPEASTPTKRSARPKKAISALSTISEEDPKKLDEGMEVGRDEEEQVPKKQGRPRGGKVQIEGINESVILGKPTRKRGRPPKSASKEKSAEDKASQAVGVVVGYGILQVYDMTPYYESHPGGDAMLRRAGKDVTNVLSTVDAHAMPWSFIKRKLAECYVGDLKK
ncbi:hypothetical protein QR680_014391 [Steinernema hermaphroditum]|uniref:Cytochrome b5 heme-binding domain-containing protein n=1 Tax=Steinernema hermaphroditum TaxID=289476 RepID=A0AA39M338_9BILA|nr:hypothetical protein QR680_014391 [Steinernema hermaphroditum]